MNIRYKLNDQHLLYHVSCMRQNCCPAICFSRCPKEVFFKGKVQKGSKKLGICISWLFMWNFLLISCFTDPSYFVPVPYNQTCPWVSFCQAVSSVLACCSKMCSDVFFLGPMCSDVFSHSPMCPNWWRRLLTAHTASQSQSSHKPNSRRDSNPFLSKTKNLSLISSENNNVHLTFSPLFHLNATKIALPMKSNKEFGQWTRLSLTK